MYVKSRSLGLSVRIQALGAQSPQACEDFEVLCFGCSSLTLYRAPCVAAIVLWHAISYHITVCPSSYLMYPYVLLVS